MTINLYKVPALQSEYDDFFTIYDVQELALPLLGSTRTLKPEHERRCRFCFRSYPEATFKKVAHTIPQFLGNKEHIYDEECDACNSRWSSYESELKHYLGILPTLTRTKGQNGVPNFHSPKDVITARKSKKRLLKGAIEIQPKQFGPDSMEVDLATGKTTITYQKPPYTPFNVYKALLKTAIAILPASELHKYSRLVDILSYDSCPPRLNPFTRVVKTVLAFEQSKASPVGIIFKKWDRYYNAHTHIFALYYQNLIFQIALPGYRDDSIIYHQPVFSWRCPPLFFREVDKDIFFENAIVDLSSVEKNTSDFERLTLAPSSSWSQNKVLFDPETGKVETGDLPVIRDIKGIVMTFEKGNRNSDVQ